MAERLDPASRPPDSPTPSHGDDVSDSQQRGSPTETHGEPVKDGGSDIGVGAPTSAGHGAFPDHDAEHGDDGHDREMSAVGPVDARAWVYGIAGILLGLVVVLAMARAAGAL